MIDSMHRLMKVGLVHFMAYPSVIKTEALVLETLKAIATDDYFDAIEITSIKDLAIRKQAHQLLQTSHMTVAFGAQPQLLGAGLNVNAIIEEERLKAVAFLKPLIDEACEAGAVGFAFLSGRYEEARKEEAYAALIRSTCELCRYAKTKGNIRIVHEVFDYNVDKRSLIGPAALAQRYAREITREFDNFGLMVDLSHIPLIGETAEQAILPVKEYLVHAHIGNCVVKDPALPAYGDVHPRFGFKGGANDVPEVTNYLALLLKIGFLNAENPPIVSFEVKPFGSEDPDVVIANAKRVLNLAWSKV